MGGIAWKPQPEMVSGSNIQAFLRAYELSSYKELLERASADPEWFWPAFFEITGLKFRRPYRQVLDLSRGKPWPKWFEGGLLNYTEWALDRWPEDRLALVWEGENGEIRRYTFGALKAEVNRFSNALHRLGLREGDRVGIYLPMLPETAIALLAVSRIGAIAVPIFSGFGPEPARVRLKDAGAKILVTADGFYRRGKAVPLKEIADEAAEGVSSLEKVVVVRRIGKGIPWKDGRDLTYRELIAEASDRYEPPAYESDAPFMIIYTSGTTGRPKGTLHVHAGFPIKAAQDMWFLFDVKPSDRIFWLTDLGWMMGPWLITGGLLLGATIVLYEGAPDYPRSDRLWQIVEDHQVTLLGITPTLIRALMAKGEKPVDDHPMPSLRMIGSTGEPWNPEPWLWTLRHVGKNRVPIINYSGGTEISGGILGCSITRPLKPASFNTPAPGVDADVWDERGEPIRGHVGYLVVKNPNPGMTRGFWRDPDRYLQTYWSRYPDVWYHGDLALIDEDGFWYILGRADDVLKIGGKRVGPAEIESALVAHEAVREAAVIGVPDPVKGEVPVGFVILRSGVNPSPELEKVLIEAVARAMGKPLAPKAVHFVPDLPRTRNAKIMRRVVRAIYLGQDPGDLSALENPQAVDTMKKIARRSQG